MQLPLTVLPLGALKLQLSPDLAVLQAVSASAGGPLRPPPWPSPDWGCAIEAEQASNVLAMAIEAKARRAVPVLARQRREIEEVERMVEVFLDR